MRSRNILRLDLTVICGSSTDPERSTSCNFNGQRRSGK
jgi:hypothetical protein